MWLWKNDDLICWLPVDSGWHGLCSDVCRLFCTRHSEKLETKTVLNTQQLVFGGELHAMYMYQHNCFSFPFPITVTFLQYWPGGAWSFMLMALVLGLLKRNDQQNEHPLLLIKGPSRVVNRVDPCSWGINSHGCIKWDTSSHLDVFPWSASVTWPNRIRLPSENHCTTGIGHHGAKIYSQHWDAIRHPTKWNPKCLWYLRLVIRDPSSVGPGQQEK